MAHGRGLTLTEALVAGKARLLAKRRGWSRWPAARPCVWRMGAGSHRSSCRRRAHLLAERGDEGNGPRQECADDERVQVKALLLRRQLQHFGAREGVRLLHAGLPVRVWGVHSAQAGRRRRQPSSHTKSTVAAKCPGACHLQLCWVRLLDATTSTASQQQRDPRRPPHAGNLYVEATFGFGSGLGTHRRVGLQSLQSA